MQQKLDKYHQKTQAYLANAYELLRVGEASKAGELFWGALVEALKGVAARKGLLFRSHSEMRKFARALATELSNAEMWDTYLLAEHLHSDFCEVALEPEDVASIAERIKKHVASLLEMMETPLPEAGG